MKDWYKTHPHLFHKKPYDRPGCDNPKRWAMERNDTTGTAAANPKPE
jgi:hypothetical protein